MSKLDANIKGINVTEGHHYSKSRAEITLDISDGNGGREDVTVTYPVQGDRHLTMLMKKKVQVGENVLLKDISLPDAKELSETIKNVVLKKD